MPNRVNRETKVVAILSRTSKAKFKLGEKRHLEDVTVGDLEDISNALEDAWMEDPRKMAGSIGPFFCFTK